MNGQLSENPLAELIRELSAKKLSGRLQLQQDKIRVALYFHAGSLLYAACNLKTLRLAEYLLKNRFVTEEDLRYIGRKPDLELAKVLTSEKRITPAQAEQIQLKQISDILRVALGWTNGTWEFDDRSHLDEELNSGFDLSDILLESARRLPTEFTAGRFPNRTELFSPVADPPQVKNLLPNEVFLLSRVDARTPLSDLLVLSGQPEPETLSMIYSLAVVGLITRAHWKTAFSDLVGTQVKETPKPLPATRVESPPPPVASVETVETFLRRLASAESHYDVLDVNRDTSMADLKSAYYDIARKYHPDRFRNAAAPLVAQIESAFARITQAYDVLRDEGQRATYNSKLNAQARASKLAQSAPKASSSTSDSRSSSSEEKSSSSFVSLAEQAEAQFKEGFAALELGQRNLAVGLLGSAARTVPHEPRYRAYYGRVLAIHESTRRLAEAELQAAIKLEPTNAEYRIMLAELFRDLGFQVRAKGEAERAVAADPNNKKARDLLRTL